MKTKKRFCRRASTDNRCWWFTVGLFVTFVLIVFLGACTPEEETLPLLPADGSPATLRVEVTPEEISQTRAADENGIKDLHLLLYNGKGELVAHNYSASSTLTLTTRSGSGYTLYAIANTGKSDLFAGTVANTEAKFKAMRTTDLASWNGLGTASHLVMVGCNTNVGIPAGDSKLTGKLEVARIVAKVTLNWGIKVGSGITITGYQLFSLPAQSYYAPDAADIDGSTDWIDAASATTVASYGGDEFYMYENRRGNISGIVHQRDKGEANAPEHATYVAFYGHDKAGREITWRVYLGENNTSDFNIKRNSQYTYNITFKSPGNADTRVDVLSVIAGDKSNSYMVQPGSGVTIPVERANDSPLELGGSSTFDSTTKTWHQLGTSDKWHACLVWESSVGLVKLSDATGTGPDGRFKVVAVGKSTEGNAVVAIKNDASQILWSWHIWVTAYDGTDVFSPAGAATSIVFMDRNLGASSAVSDDLGTAGLHYQWGRKDPFPGIGQHGGSWSGGKRLAYNDAGKEYEITYNISAGLAAAVRKPDAIIVTYDFFDWLTVDDTKQKDDLWTGDAANPKSVFDPCPKGWRVPAFDKGVSPFAWMANGSTKEAHGLSWGTGFFPFSLSGSTINGMLLSAGQGYYWTGATQGQGGAVCIIQEKQQPTSSEEARSVTCSIRCCKE